MVDPSAGDPPKKPQDKTFPLPSWKKIAEFVVGVFQLQRSVKKLEEQNEALRAQIERLQRQSDEQAGQLRTILHLIESTVHERAARTAEQAAVRAIQKLLALRDDSEA